MNLNIHPDIAKLLKYNEDLEQSTCPLCKKVFVSHKYSGVKCDCSLVAQGAYLGFQIYIDNKIYIIHQYFKLNKTYIRPENQREFCIDYLINFNFDDLEQLNEQILTCIMFS